MPEERRLLLKGPFRVDFRYYDGRDRVADTLEMMRLCLGSTELTAEEAKPFFKLIRGCIRRKKEKEKP